LLELILNGLKEEKEIMEKRFFENTRKPTQTLGGKIMLFMMNHGHNAMAMWGLACVNFSGCEQILDIGCGGGKNIANLLKLAPTATICGIDYAPASVERTISYNQAAVSDGRLDVKEASVEAIPYENDTFDVVTAFETIYFWPSIVKSFKEVLRVMKKGGVFLVCNEMHRPEGNEKWIEMLDLIIYTSKQIQGFMQQAGFSNIEIHEHENGQWLGVIGKKIN